MKPRFIYRAYKARYRDQRSEISTVLAALQPGDVAADVGAHKGAYLYWMRKAVGPGGRVFGFEPQPGLARYLLSVCTAMHWANVFVRECALSDSAGRGTLNVPGDTDSPSASLEAVAPGQGSGRTYECQIDTLDHQLGQEQRLALLKVDVEGHELQVFRGATELLRRCSPLLLFECEVRHLTRHSMQDVFAFLEGLGYEGSFFSPTGLLRLGDFDPSVHQRHDAERFWDAPGYCNNFLFHRSGRLGLGQG